MRRRAQPRGARGALRGRAAAGAGRARRRSTRATWWSSGRRTRTCRSIPSSSLDGVRAALARKPVVAVSPIVGGRAVKGPLGDDDPRAHRRSRAPAARDRAALRRRCLRGDRRRARRRGAASTACRVLRDRHGHARRATTPAPRARGRSPSRAELAHVSAGRGRSCRPSAFDRGKSRLAPVLDDDGARRVRARAVRARARRAAGVGRARRRAGGDRLADGRGGGARPRRARCSAMRRARRRSPPIVDAALAELAARGARGGAGADGRSAARSPPTTCARWSRASTTHDVVVVRADDGRHTNALGARAARPHARPRFGRADSFDAHLAAARAAGLRVAVVDNARIAFDVDGPEDHAQPGRGAARDRARPA